MRDVVYWVITGSLIANTLAYTTFLFLYIFTCWPRDKIWYPIVPGRCMPVNELNLAVGTLNAILDIEALFVPAWAIWQLRMEVRKKLSVFAVFAVGALAVAIGCLGMYYRVRTLTHKDDATWTLTQSSITCMAELASFIIVGCFPCVPRIFRRLRQRNTPTATRSYSNGPTPPSKSLAISKSNGISESHSKHSKVPPTSSEVHLELHQYYENDSNGTGSV